jgi:hypothetical protein
MAVLALQVFCGAVRQNELALFTDKSMWRLA